MTLRYTNLKPSILLLGLSFDVTGSTVADPPLSAGLVWV